MEILTIIPARKESKRLPNKNKIDLNGKPLIEYTLQNTLDSKYIDKVVVSSDDNEIKSIVNKYSDTRSIDLRFDRRPKDLRGDDISTQQVVDDVRTRYKCDVVLLLQVTSPLRKAKQIDKCMEMYYSTPFESIVSIKRIAPYTFYPNGAMYMFRDRMWCDNMGFFLMDNRSSLDIDTIEDLKLGEVYMNDDNS